MNSVVILAVNTVAVALWGVVLALSVFLSVFQPVELAAAVAVFSIGLAASAVIANYLGPVAGVLIGPLLGAAAATAVLGKPFWLAAFAAALLPATFLSPEHTGLLVLLLFAATGAASLRVFRRARIRV